MTIPPLDLRASRAHGPARRFGRGDRRYLLNHALAGAVARSGYPIANALLFSGAQYFSRTQTTAGNARATFEFIYRRAALGLALEPLYSVDATSGARDFFIAFDGSDRLCLYDQVGLSYNQRISTRTFRDTTSYYHIVVWFDGPNPVAGSRIRAWVNGEEITLWDISINQHTGSALQDAGVAHHIGHRIAGARSASGTLARACRIDGALVSCAVFGKVDAVTGSWQARKLSGVSWGANGFCLGASFAATALGVDGSGQDNNWGATGFVASDLVGDSPTNVFATLTPLNKGSRVTLVEGGLKYMVSAGAAGSGNASNAFSSFPIPATGTWRMQVTIGTGSGSAKGIFGVCALAAPDLATPDYAWYQSETGIVDTNGVNIATGATVSLNDVVDVVADADAGTVAFYRNGVLLTSSVYAPAGKVFVVRNYTATVAQGPFVVNFGQRVWAYFIPGACGLGTASMPVTLGRAGGSFIGNTLADGPLVHTGAVPATLTINGNAVTWGVQADQLATGFKLRSASSTYNRAGANAWAATYERKPTVGPGRVPANAQWK